MTEPGAIQLHHGRKFLDLCRIAGEVDLDDLIKNEVTYYPIVPWHQVISCRGDIDWHRDEYHPKWSVLLILRNDANWHLFQKGRGRTLNATPMPVGGIVVFDSHRPHAALGIEGRFNDHRDGVLVALVEECEFKSETHQARVRLEKMRCK